MITSEQQADINAAAALMSNALRRARGNPMVAASILAQELLAARKTIDDVSRALQEWRAEVAT